MSNLFVRLGITVIVVGSFCILMATGVLGHDIEAQFVCGIVGFVAIVMGVALIQLMKDDVKESIKFEG